MLRAAPSSVAPPAEQVQSGGEVLRMVLDSDTLLIGCVAFALLAMVTLSRVASRRRKSRQIRRTSHAQTKAIHEFLETVRAGSGSARQGVWHYDFETGAEQFSDELIAILGGQATVKTSDIDFARLAREHEDATEPYEAHFAIEAPDGGKRSFTFQACNLPSAAGQSRRVVAIVREIESEVAARSEPAPSSD